MKKEPAFPRYVSIQTTSLCNASCIFCPYPEIKRLFPSKVMEDQLFEKIINDCRANTDLTFINLFMNNEPLTDPHIVERIEYVKETLPQVFVNIYTNGFLLTEETVDRLKSSKFDWISISFHGIRKATIEKTMGIPYDKTLNRINTFIQNVKRERGGHIKEFIGINFLKHENLTDEEKDEAIRYWKSKGIGHVAYFPGSISRAGNVNNLPGCYNRGKVLGCSSVLEDEMIHIIEDGKVVLCCMDWRREVILGDLKKQSIHEVWNGRRKDTWKMIQGRAEMPKDFLCKRCEEAVVGIDKGDTSEMLDILFVHLPPWPPETPPCLVSSLASSLDTCKIKTGVLDLNIEAYNIITESQRILWIPDNFKKWRYKENYKRLVEKEGLRDSINHCVRKLVSVNTQVMFFLINADNMRFASDIAVKLKKFLPGIMIIFGVSDISLKQKRKVAPRNVVDLYIYGEDTVPLLKIIKDRNFQNNKDS